MSVWLTQGQWSFGGTIRLRLWIIGVQLWKFDDGALLITAHFGPLELALGRKVEVA